MTREELLDKALHCNRCGTCRGVTQDEIPDVAFATQCPCGSTFYGCYEPSGLMYMARGIAMGNLQWNEDLARVLYACTLCGYCDDFCQRGYRHTPAIEILEELRRNIPQKLKPKSLQKATESLNIPEGQKLATLAAYGIGDIAPGKKADTVFFPDNTLMLNTAKLRQIGYIIRKSGKKVSCFISEPLPPVSATLNFGGCDDALAACMAEIDDRLEDAAVKKVLVYNPESLSVLKRNSKAGVEFISMTSFYAGVLKSKKPKKLKMPSVTYQDPCHLGRYAKDYTAPREVIAALGLKLNEMWRSGNNSLCCGAGGGVLAGNPELAKKYAENRWHEARATGAKVMITACPYCLANLSGARPKDFKMVDITSLVAQAYGFTGKEGGK